jgi:type I restriction enzyme S subunit
MAKYRFEQIAINSTEKKKPVEEDRFTYLGLEHLDSGSLKVTRFGSDVAPIGEKLIMHKGDVLFGKRRAYQKKVAIAPFDGIFSAHGMVLRPNVDVIDPDFFPLFISSDYFLDVAIKISVGSLSPTINWRDLKVLEFELPDLETQRKLAAVLWSINDTMEAYKKLISATDELVKSQFIEMFGDPIENTKEWPIVQLGDIAEIRIGPFGSLLHKEDYVAGGHALVNPSHITDGSICIDPDLTISDEKYQELSAYKLLKGDVVLGRRGEMGRCAVVCEDGLVCGTGSMIIRPTNRMHPYFLQNILSSPAYKSVLEGKAVGATMKNLNVMIVSSLTIPALPIDMQDRFISFVHQSDKSKFAVQNCSNLNLSRCLGQRRIVAIK